MQTNWLVNGVCPTFLPLKVSFDLPQPILDPATIEAHILLHYHMEWVSRLGFRFVELMPAIWSDCVNRGSIRQFGKIGLQTMFTLLLAYEAVDTNENWEPCN